MKKEQIHATRKQINILRNTFGTIVTVEKHSIIGYDHAIKVQVAHPLVMEAMHSLRLAREWSGKLLGYQGSPEPVAGTYNPKDADDATTESMPVTEGAIENLSLLRAEIQKVLDIVDGPTAPEYKPTRNQARAITNIFNHLTEARFAIGNLIGELRVSEAKEVDQAIEKPKVTQGKKSVADADKKVE